MRATLITLFSISLLAGFTGCDSDSDSVNEILDPNVTYTIEGDWMTDWVHPVTGLTYPLRITKIDDTNYTVRLYSCGDNLHTGVRIENTLTFSEVPPITLSFIDATHFLMTRENTVDYTGVKCNGDCLRNCPPFCQASPCQLWESCNEAADQCELLTDTCPCFTYDDITTLVNPNQKLTTTFDGWPLIKLKKAPGTLEPNERAQVYFSDDHASPICYIVWDSGPGDTLIQHLIDVPVYNGCYAILEQWATDHSLPEVP
jgi:hypothetical protein